MLVFKKNESRSIGNPHLLEGRTWVLRICSARRPQIQLRWDLNGVPEPGIACTDAQESANLRCGNQVPAMQ